MQVTSTSFTNNFLYQIGQLETQQSALQNQSASGLKVTRPEDNPEAMNQVLNLQTEASANTQYQTNIAHLQTSATTASDALNSLQTLVEQAGETAIQSGSLSSPTQLNSSAIQISQLIKQALQLANTKDAQGNYIFGGTSTGAPPFTATTDASGNITGVAYSGNTAVAQSEIGPGFTVTVQSPGANSTGSGASGVFTDSRAGADIFNHLISLQQHLQSGDTTSIASIDCPALTKDEDNVVGQISGNAVLQSALESAGNVASQKSTNLDTEITNASSADLAQTLTQLEQAQTAYQAALESGTKVMGMSLLNYLQ